MPTGLDEIVGHRSAVIHSPEAPLAQGETIGKRLRSAFRFWDQNLDPRRRAIIAGIFFSMALLTLLSSGFANLSKGNVGMSIYISLVITMILARRGFFSGRVSVFVDRDGERVEIRQKIRPVLKADRVQPLLETRMMSADEAFEVYPPHTRVMGIVHNGEARAYPLAVLSYREVAYDIIGGDPLAVTWSPFCYSARAFKISQDDQSNFIPHFGFTGRLVVNSPVMFDARTGVHWLQYLGAPLGGPDIGTRLPEMPSVNTTLRAWTDAYPETEVLDDRVAPITDLFDRYYASGRAGMHKAPHRDVRWPAKEIVAGIDLNGDACAFPMSWLQIEPVVNETVGDMPLVVAYEEHTASVMAFKAETSGGRALTFEAGVWDEPEGELEDGLEDEEDWDDEEPDDELPVDELSEEEFPENELEDGEEDELEEEEDWDDEDEEEEYEPMMLYDVETGSQWHATNGTCVEGELVGERLEPVVAGLSFWFAWTNFYPSTRLPTSPDLSGLAPKSPESDDFDDEDDTEDDD